MAVLPIVRYMILCEDWRVDPARPRRVDIFGLLSNIDSVEQPPYPLLYRELCVFMILAEARGRGEAQIICVFEETGQPIFGTPKRQCGFTQGPLDVVGLPFRIKDCQFPQAGVYLVQFWYNDQKLDERPLRLR